MLRSRGLSRFSTADSWIRSDVIATVQAFDPETLAVLEYLQSKRNFRPYPIATNTDTPNNNNNNNNNNTINNNNKSSGDSRAKAEADAATKVDVLTDDTDNTDDEEEVDVGNKRREPSLTSAEPELESGKREGRRGGERGKVKASVNPNLPHANSPRTPLPKNLSLSIKSTSKNVLRSVISSLGFYGVDYYTNSDMLGLNPPVAAVDEELRVAGEESVGERARASTDTFTGVDVEMNIEPSSSPTTTSPSKPDGRDGHDLKPVGEREGEGEGEGCVRSYNNNNNNNTKAESALLHGRDLDLDLDRAAREDAELTHSLLRRCLLYVCWSDTTEKRTLRPMHHDLSLSKVSDFWVGSG